MRTSLAIGLYCVAGACAGGGLVALIAAAALSEATVDRWASAFLATVALRALPIGLVLAGAAFAIYPRSEEASAEATSPRVVGGAEVVVA